MRKLLLATASLLALTTAATADDGYNHSYRYWDSFLTWSSNNKPMCGISTKFNNGGMFMLKFENGKMFEQFMSTRWPHNLKTGEKVEVAMQVDNAPGVRFDTSVSYTPQYGNLMLEFTFDPNETNPDTGDEYWHESINLLKNGLNLHIHFNGTVQDWNANLTGSGDAIADFSRCVVAMLQVHDQENN